MESFDIADVVVEDVSTLVIRHPTTGAPTSWQMQIAGPAHPATIAMQNEVSREQMREQRAIEQARANGRKYKAEEKDPEEEHNRTMRRVARRIVGWTDVSLNGEPFPYSPENAASIMTDPKRG